jgi:hypothetical protein
MVKAITADGQKCKEEKKKRPYVDKIVSQLLGNGVK